MKALVRAASSLRTSAERWLRFPFASKDPFAPPLTSLRALSLATALAQHHDAVTGTERAAVLADYSLRFASPIADVRADFAAALAAFVAPGAALALSPSPPTLPPPDGAAAVVVVANPSAHPRDVTVRVKVQSCGAKVVDMAGGVVSSVTAKNSEGHLLTFIAKGVPPVGASSFAIVRYDRGGGGDAERAATQRACARIRRASLRFRTAARPSNLWTGTSRPSREPAKRSERLSCARRRMEALRST